MMKAQVRFALREALFLTILAATPACVHLHVQIDEYRQAVDSGSGDWRVGFGRVDITPLPGYPLGGHSLGGRMSRGRWLPLYARSTYFRDPAGHELVLVSCDLAALPAGLQETVAYLVNRRYPTLSRDNIIIAATHTHQGPGNYMTSNFYNGFLSQLPGFDRALFDGLARRIVSSVCTAVTRSLLPGPVFISWGSSDVHRLIGVGTVLPFARNRAVAPFLENKGDPTDPLRPDACAFLFPGAKPPAPCKCDVIRENCDPGYIRANAYNPVLTRIVVARALNGKRVDIGELVFFGVHPTAMADHSAFYSSDFTGLAMRQLEKEVQDPYFVSAFFNGSEGDVSPNWNRQDAEDVRALAVAFREAVKSVVATTLISPTAELWVARHAVTQRKFCRGSVPLMGVATVGGAEDGRAVTFDMGWRAPDRSGLEYKKRSIFTRLGLWRINNPGQAPKQPGLDYDTGDLLSITNSLAPPGHYPAEVPVMTARVGELTFLAVPFEVTTMASLEIRKRVEDLLGPTPLLIALANEYLSYVTTKAEYLVQDYEGSSTLYGPDSARCLADALRATVGAADSGGRMIPAANFDAGGGPMFDMPLGPGFWGQNAWYQDQGLESPFAEQAFQPAWPRFEWLSDTDGRIAIYRYEGRWTEVTDDDDGSLLLELIDGRGSRTTWNAVWLARDRSSNPVGERWPRAADLRDGRPAIFVVKSSSQGVTTVRCSTTFTLADAAASKLALPLKADSCPPGVN